jgi:uncharacterized protein
MGRSPASPRTSPTHGRLLVFAKAPVPGEVKTRLMPDLNAEACARLQRRLIERTLQTSLKAALRPVELWCAPDCAHSFFTQCVAKFNVELRAQQGGDLGMRMHHALSTALTDANFALIIGCDCPTLGSEYLTQASQALVDGVPVVLGPAEDGGYVLIGARGTARELFEGIEWGTSRVLAQTRDRLQSLKWRWRELKPLWDIDRPTDLCRLSNHDHA